jgi:hypothetical protein
MVQSIIRRYQEMRDELEMEKPKVVVRWKRLEAFHVLCHVKWKQC